MSNALHVDKCGRVWAMEMVNISTLSVGDTVLHYGDVVTVSRCDLSRCSMMGVLFRGDSYALGRKKIARLNKAP